VASSTKKIRYGYTTGACAAAAAKAAAILLLNGEPGVKGLKRQCAKKHVGRVDIPFPDGSRHTFVVSHSSLLTHHPSLTASASVIKDAGDDPDVTNGAEIVATVRMMGPHNTQDSSVIFKGGRGVGTVTKPGLPVPVGDPAINPVPRKMIREAVEEAFQECEESRVRSKRMNKDVTPSHLTPHSLRCIEITIEVPKGEELAKKTLNARLGIIGGISILGTSGIVKPLSTEAWTSSISTAMDVAKASGLEEIVLSVGRVSERAHIKKYGLREEAYVMMGDYFEFSLLDAKKHDFSKIHISAHWAKMLKISMSTPQTHVKHGAIDIKKGVVHLNSLGIAVPEDRDFNTAREIYDYLVSMCGRSLSEFKKVCITAKRYAEGITAGITVTTHLVSYDGDIIVDSE
jgi:cobalt-precorrin-5B (C1)-methyltransferase